MTIQEINQYERVTKMLKNFIDADLNVGLFLSFSQSVTSRPVAIREYLIRFAPRRGSSRNIAKYWVAVGKHLETAMKQIDKEYLPVLDDKR